LRHTFPHLPEKNSTGLNASNNTHPLRLRVKGRMEHEPSNELCGAIVRHVEPDQAVGSMPPISPEKMLIQAEKRGLRKPVKQRDQVLVRPKPLNPRR
jgi:hypothetical protein